MSTAISLDIDDSIAEPGSPDSQLRAACITSARAASMSASFSASMNWIACRDTNGLPNVTRPRA